MSNTKKNEEPKKRTVCVVGHKNPDTDSVCAAISYAYLKNQLDSNYNYVPYRAGRINSETQFVLDSFGFDMPFLLENIGTRVKDMEIRKVPGVRSDISLKQAWTLMKEQNVFTLPITNEENQLKGLITINDIAQSYMEDYDSAIVSTAKTPYRNIMDTLDAKMVVGDPEAYFEKGKVLIAAANPDVMENYIKENDMVILGNRYEGQLSAIEMKAGCMIVCLGAPVSQTIQKIAQEQGCTVLVTPLDTYTVARLINQSMPVSHFMRKDHLQTFHLSDYTESVRDIMSQKRYRDFPILDKNGYYVGMISRRNLLGVHKRELILVDHNEESQAVDNVQDADILEIIDHHRLGSLETITPVYFRNQPVGSTCTIIYQMYQENCINIPPDIAGLLCSAILSDTLQFRSPTCTPLDVSSANALAEIARVNCEDLAGKMFSAGSNIQDKTPEEIYYQDFKQYEVGERKIGIGQITSMKDEDLARAKELVAPFLEDLSEQKMLDLVCFMLTDIVEETTELLCYGEDADKIIEQAFHQPLKGNSTNLRGVVSRKKQMVPSLIAGINQVVGV